jgi:hypothetical protein
MSICDDDDDNDEEMTVARWTLPRRRPTSARHPHTISRAASDVSVDAPTAPRRAYGDGVLALGTQETTPPRPTRAVPPPIPRIKPVPRVGRSRPRMTVAPSTVAAPPPLIVVAPPVTAVLAALEAPPEPVARPPRRRRGLRLVALLMLLAGAGGAAAATHAPERVVALYREITR